MGPMDWRVPRDLTLVSVSRMVRPLGRVGWQNFPVASEKFGWMGRRKLWGAGSLEKKSTVI